MSDQIWRCPECETLNKGDSCLVCGEKKPIRTANNNSQNYISQNYNSPTPTKTIETPATPPPPVKKGVNPVLVIILLIVTLIAIIYFVSAANDSKKDTQSIQHTTSEIISEQITTIEENISYENTVTSETIPEFNVSRFKTALKDILNNEREGIYLEPLKGNMELQGVVSKLVIDVSDGKYTMGTLKKYFSDKTKFTARAAYFEESFDLASYSDEKEAAQALVNYERENFSCRWLMEKYKYFEAEVILKDDGTYGVVFLLAGYKSSTSE